MRQREYIMNDRMNLMSQKLGGHSFPETERANVRDEEKEMSWQREEPEAIES